LNCASGDEQGRPLWLIAKERGDSPFKIDACMAAALSWEARTDAIAAGMTGTASVWEDDSYEMFVI
jgi:hypothetical protein